MCYCDPSIRTPYCGKFGCQPTPLIKATDPVPPYVLNLKGPATPIHAQTMDKVPNNLIEYINAAIKENWDGERAEVSINEIENTMGMKTTFQKIRDLFVNYGWCVDHRATITDSWLVFTIKK